MKMVKSLQMHNKTYDLPEDFLGKQKYSSSESVNQGQT